MIKSIRFTAEIEGVTVNVELAAGPDAKLGALQDVYEKLSTAITLAETELPSACACDEVELPISGKMTVEDITDRIRAKRQPIGSVTLEDVGLSQEPGVRARVDVLERTREYGANREMADISNFGAAAGEALADVESDVDEETALKAYEALLDEARVKDPVREVTAEELIMLRHIAASESRGIYLWPAAESPFHRRLRDPAGQPLVRVDADGYAHLTPAGEWAVNRADRVGQAQRRRGRHAVQYKA